MRRSSIAVSPRTSNDRAIVLTAASSLTTSASPALANCCFSLSHRETDHSSWSAALTIQSTGRNEFPEPFPAA